MFDLLIQNAMVLDGSGAEAFPADIGIRDGKIAAVGALRAENCPVLDAAGKTATPGFIDIHRHADLAAFRPDFGALELHQGLTTIVNGNCGLSAAPFGSAHRQEILDYLTPILGRAPERFPTQSLAAYYAALRERPLPINVGMLVGNGVLRADALGYGAQHPQPEQLREICRAMEGALSDGALGVSLGLGYAPECFYSTQELIRALAPLADGNIPVTVHMREEGSAVDEAVEEMIALARALRCPVHLSHLKAMGKRNWGKKIPAILKRLEQVRGEGLDISCDVYPYTAGSTQLLHIMPPDLLRGGTEEICRRLRDPATRRALTERLHTATDFDNISLLVGWDNILMSSLTLPENQRYAGLSVQKIAELRGQTPEDCVFDLLAEERCAITMIDFIAAEADIGAILRADFSNVISDSTYPTEGRPHPRLYGTFARVIEKYVYADGVLKLPQAIRKMTSVPAEVLRLRGKGRIAPGYDADINLFDPHGIHEIGTYSDPSRFAEGPSEVLVAGRLAVRNGALTGIAAGTIVR